ncbi:MAG: heparinase II/III family protein [Clostridia bacterium]|nr:heparinase II/III family protein [Clostridia bacterium]
MRRYSYDEILSILKKHDGEAFVFTDADRERILADKGMQEQLSTLRKYADTIGAEPIPTLTFSAFSRFELDGDRTEFQSLYFRHRHLLAAFTILYWLYGREEDRKILEDTIWAILDEYTWSVPAHLRGTGLTTLQEDGYMIDLFAAETGEALAEMLSLVGDKITPIVRMRTERYIDERILKSATTPFWWNSGCTNNWSAVCSGSVSMCAIYQEKNVERLAEILAFCIDNLQSNFYRGFSDDGVCLEGISYWTYGFGYFTYFADLLKKRTGGEIDLFLDEPVKKIALFFGKCFFPGGATVAFSDGSARGKYQPALAAYYHTLYPEEFAMPAPSLISMNYPQDGCARFALLLRNFVWAASKITTDGKPIYGTYLFPSAQWYLASTERGIGIAIKGGNNEEPHNHNDVGSFHIYKNGVPLLVDIGAPRYDKFYFSNQRYENFAASSRSHSVPIVNNALQKNGKEYKAVDMTMDESGVRMDIAPAYALAELSSLIRDIRFETASGVTTLHDTFTFTEMPSRIVERFPLNTEPVVSDGIATITSDGESLSIIFDPTVFDAEVSFELVKRHNYLTTKSALDTSDNFRKVYLLDLIVKEPKTTTEVSVKIQ